MSRPAEPSRQQPAVIAHFSRPDRRYEPHEPIVVRYEVELPANTQVRAVERSILWYTEGKGEEDLGIHHFERITERGAVDAAAVAGGFECRLPPSPLSYEGMIVKIRWCVRIRLFFEAGKDFVSEHVFDLGDLPAVALLPS